MQKIHHKRSHKLRATLLIAVALLVIVAGATYYYFIMRPSSSPSDQTSDQSSGVHPAPPTPDETNAGNDKKQESVDNSTTDTPPAATDPISVTQTASGRNGTIFQIRYLINEELANGTCTLTLVNGTKSIKKTAAVQANASSSTCQGFDISMGELTSGTWQATLLVESNNRSGEVVTDIQID